MCGWKRFIKIAQNPKETEKGKKLRITIIKIIIKTNLFVKKDFRKLSSAETKPCNQVTLGKMMESSIFLYYANTLKWNLRKMIQAQHMSCRPKEVRQTCRLWQESEFCRYLLEKTNERVTPEVKTGSYTCCSAPKRVETEESYSQDTKYNRLNSCLGN